MLLFVLRLKFRKFCQFGKLKTPIHTDDFDFIYTIIQFSKQSERIQFLFSIKKNYSRNAEDLSEVETTEECRSDDLSKTVIENLICYHQ